MTFRKWAVRIVCLAGGLVVFVVLVAFFVGPDSAANIALARRSPIGGYAPDSPLPKHLGRCAAAHASLGGVGTLQRRLYFRKLYVQYLPE